MSSVIENGMITSIEQLEHDFPALVSNPMWSDIKLKIQQGTAPPQPTPPPPPQGSDYVLDGRVSSLMLLIGLVSWYSTFTIAFYSGKNVIHEDICNWISITILSISTAIMIHVLRKNTSWQRKGFIRCLQESSDASGEYQPLLLSGPSTEVSDQTSSVPIIGIYIFGICNFVLSMVYIIDIARCVPVLIRKIYKYREIMFITADCLQVIFTFAQMAFFRVFRAASFKNCSWFQYTFIITISANILVWMVNVAKETAIVLGVTVEYQTMDWPLIDLQSANKSNINDDVVLCYNQMLDPTIHFFLSVFQPFSKVYNLLALSILFQYWNGLHSMRRNTRNARHNTVGNTRDNTTDNTSDSTSDSARHNTRGNTADSTTDNTSDNASSNANIQISQIAGNLNPAEDRHLHRTFISHAKSALWLTLIAFLPLVMASMMITSIFLRHQLYYNFHMFTFLAFKLGHLISAGLGKRYLNKTGLFTYKPLSGNEILHLVSVCGLYVLIPCDAIPAVGALFGSRSNLPNDDITHSTASQYAVLVLSIVNAVEVYMQTILLLNTRRQTRNIDARAIVSLRRCLIYMLIANIMDWLILTIVSPEHGTYAYPSTVWFFGKSMLVVNIIFVPLAAFYRFNSAVLCYQALVSLQFNEN